MDENASHVSRPPPVAIFYVRAWHEDGYFRARVSRCLDVTLDEPMSESLTANPEDLAAQLADWLQALPQTLAY